MKDWIRASDKSAFSNLFDLCFLSEFWTSKKALNQIKDFWVIVMQTLSSFPGAHPFRVLHNSKNRCVGFTETFQTNSPLCWGNYGKFLPQVHALKKEAWAKQVVTAPPTCSSGLCLPCRVCRHAGVQANFTARVFSADLQPVEGQMKSGQKKKT